MRISWLGSAAVVAALVGCGSVSDKNNNDGGGGDDVAADFTLALAPTSLSIPIASSKDVTVTVSRSGGAGEITLSTESLPANLTATFTPATLSSDTNTATLTVTAVGGMAPSTGMFTVSATGSGSMKTATVSVSTTTITVSGKVVGEDSGVTVGLVGKPSVTTGAGGLFTFTDVTPPYDLYVVGLNGQLLGNNTYPAVNFYDDLTRADPTVVRPAAAGFPFLTATCNTTTNGATLFGTRQGDGIDSDPLQLIWTGGGNSTTSNGTYSFCARAPSSGELYGFQYAAAASGAPTAMRRGVTATTSLTVNTSKNLPIALVASSAVVTGTFTVPAGFPVPSIGISQQVAADVAFSVPQYTSASAAATVLAVPGLSSAFFVTSSTGGATTSYSRPVAGVATDLTFTLPDPAAQLAPVQAATGVTTATPFQWSGPDATIFLTNFVSSGKVAYHVFTAKKQLSIPVVNEIPLPSAANFSWSVVGFAAHSSIDDAAAMTKLDAASSSDFTGPARASTSSASRTFTTAN